MSYVVVTNRYEHAPLAAGPFRIQAEAKAWLKEQGWHPPDVAYNGDNPGEWMRGGYTGYIVKLEKPTA